MRRRRNQGRMRDHGPSQMMRDPTEPRPQLIDSGRAAPEHAATFVGIMNVLHTQPAAPVFGRLLRKELERDDCIDAFAFDLYWHELREDVLAVRQRTGNAMFSENFELAADRARLYRHDFPPKLRWSRNPPDQEPSRPPGG
ncbi:MAG: hypothetical protein M3Y62_05080, partial [Candidatus Dormibacteraeota bacterium]|nr:hypothetical protein [Candidatus Dormibacteraeota bacterium]